MTNIQRILALEAAVVACEEVRLSGLSYPENNDFRKALSALSEQLDNIIDEYFEGTQFHEFLEQQKQAVALLNSNPAAFGCDDENIDMMKFVNVEI